MKGVYVRNGSKTQFSGVEKKIKSQIDVLSEHFEMSEIIIEKKEASPIESVLWRLPGGSWGARYEEALKEMASRVEGLGEDCFFYIRIGLLDKKYLDFLHTLKKRFPQAVVLLEIPTYPYSLELLQSRTMFPWFFKYILLKNRLSPYIDRVVTYSDEKVIFNTTTIRISNGIMVGSPPQIRRESEYDNCGMINILAVAQFQKSHGYERIIEGLAQYYSKPDVREIVLHMVGDGEERSHYQKLADKYGLKDKIVFYGMRYGDELDELYQKADLCLGMFGLYKRKITRVYSSLKIAEYLSHGLPVLTGVKEKALENLDHKYYYEVPNNDKPVNIEEIVEFYMNLRSGLSLGDIRSDLYDYAKKNIDMSVTMKPVVDYIDSRA